MRSIRVAMGAMAAIAALGACESGENRAEVAGVQFERTTTTAAPTPSTVAPPRLAEATTTTIARPAPTTTTTTVAPRRIVVERADNGGYFNHDPDNPEQAGAGSATQAGREIDEFSFYAYVGSSDADGRSPIYGNIKNQGPRTVRFPGGLTVKMTITPPSGQPFVVEVRHPEHTELPPGGEVPIKGEVRVSEPGGYQYVGETTVEHEA